MKIKCVSNVNVFGYQSAYLTSGKVYQFKPMFYTDTIGEITVDDGQVIYEDIISPYHGKYEVTCD